ncbi:hypothetical protein [Streptomyces sp. NPDC056948]|uniref:hypothetical protein n=1 Tax=Streptomyces sp. NPDC056948 TaxID=3345975 RepID=UPI0036290152
MTDLICRFLTWAGLLAVPRSGRCRPAHPPRSWSAATSPEWAPLPAHRSPYGTGTALDGTATVAVRPYLVAHEQRQRRRELAMAILRPDMPGPYWHEGTEVA